MVHELVLYAHLLLFVFWLGADLGVFLSARAVVAPGRTPADRLNAAWMMSAIDVAPRVAASLMLTVGGVLTEFVGISHPAWQMAGIVLLGPAWLGLVLTGWFRRGTGLGAAVDRAETALRVLMIPAVLMSVAWSWSTGRLDDAPYVAGKLLLFAVLMGLGLWMRLCFAPFRRGLELLASRGEISAAEEGVMAASVRSARPLVLAAWLALMVAAWLGISRPGAPEPVPAVPGLAALGSAEVPVLRP
jgi:hypothetical protein